MQQEFQPHVWKSCWDVLVEGRSPADVAAALGVSLDVVYAAKYRVLRRLREQLRGMLT